MHAASAYRAARETMRAAGVARAPAAVGLSCGRLGPQTLRNAFAAEHFAAGLPLPETFAYLTHAMGYSTDGERQDAVATLHAAWRKDSMRNVSP